MAKKDVTIVGKIVYPKSGFKKLYCSYTDDIGVQVAECRGSNIKNFDMISVGDVLEAVTYKGQDGPMFEII